MEKLVNRALHYATVMCQDTQYQKGFSDGAFHGYQQGAIDQEDINIERTINWLAENWRKYINVGLDGIICFNHWSNDYKNFIKENNKFNETIQG